jgi:hypothetical protein
MPQFHLISPFDGSKAIHKPCRATDLYVGAYAGSERRMKIYVPANFRKDEEARAKALRARHDDASLKEFR